MPSKNSIKQYEEGAYYHIYNRGVEKRKIFQDSQDYAVFLSYLKTYLTPEEDKPVYLKKGLKNYNSEITLVCYCLMPNHFHLLVRQDTRKSIDRFTKSLLTKYSMYFNKKYDRVGKLFQGVYKAVKILNERQLLYLTKYIHNNPKNYSHKMLYTSLPNYLERVKQSWLNPDVVMGYFSQTQKGMRYEDFLLEENPADVNITKLVIE